MDDDIFFPTCHVHEVNVNFSFQLAPAAVETSWNDLVKENPHTAEETNGSLNRVKQLIPSIHLNEWSIITIQQIITTRSLHIVLMIAW